MLKYAGQHRHTSHTTIKQSQSMPYGPMKMFASPVLCALAACTTNFGIVYELISYGVAVLWWMCILVVVVEPLVFLLFYLYFARHRTTKEPNGSDQQLYLAQICLFALLLLLLLMWFCWLAVADRIDCFVRCCARFGCGNQHREHILTHIHRHNVPEHLLCKVGYIHTGRN